MKIEVFLSRNGDGIGLRCELDSVIYIYAQDWPEILINGRRSACVIASALAESFEYSIVRPNAGRETPRVEAASRRFRLDRTILWR